MLLPVAGGLLLALWKTGKENLKTIIILLAAALIGSVLVETYNVTYSNDEAVLQCPICKQLTPTYKAKTNLADGKWCGRCGVEPVLINYRGAMAAGVPQKSQKSN